MQSQRESAANCISSFKLAALLNTPRWRSSHNSVALFFSMAAPMSAPTVASQPTEAPTKSAASSNFPSGKFIKAGTTNYGLLFNDDGTFSVFEGDNTLVRATYSVDGNVFTETSNDGGCETNMAFTYTFDGTNLTFNYVGNPDDDAACDGRHADFNSVTYSLSQ